MAGEFDPCAQGNRVEGLGAPRVGGGQQIGEELGKLCQGGARIAAQQGLLQGAEAAQHGLALVACGGVVAAGLVERFGRQRDINLNPAVG
ncbi:MAG TPA: hypothetical protein VK726_05275 [Acetobacteraceae bacterium]|nr:hypothetical protein [Acetobacteraceae bacterium]